ncbi:molybdenum cofactor synthesis domain protein [Chloroherpeton thalassium ATCC 35110]|uniref:Molybdenum cofactor synthesis domain protein n=1 Tax=Chloroherpeton thalassium (strain ATCC 35110 / GB-78) TaxID=517418 RepID=B3QV96_CHLT3|nr:MogA/MoaB family molybdenum cofactor biosynthesis protein [Chloroherpeton thalassium]ACF13050.1 molybdenum cofactor synthesis domain protein [Chloroherpeton thalassium ATCC 35110]
MTENKPIGRARQGQGINRKITVAIITVSDLAFEGIYKDESGPIVANVFPEDVYDIISKTIVADELNGIMNELIRCSDEEHADVIVTVGGSGCSSRDVTPDATAKVIEKEVPGISDVIRIANWQNYPKMIYSRGMSGVRNDSLIVNLPGNPEGARIAIETIVGSIPNCIKTLQTQKPRKKRQWTGNAGSGRSASVGSSKTPRFRKPT